MPPLTPVQAAAAGPLTVGRIDVAPGAVTGGYRDDAACTPQPWTAPAPAPAGAGADATAALTPAVQRELGDALGFPVVSSPPADFALDLRIRSLTLDLCHTVGVFGPGTTGTAHGVLAARVRAADSGVTVFETPSLTAGARLEAPTAGPAAAILTDAMVREALRRLAADNRFRRALVRRAPSTMAQASVSDPLFSPALFVTAAGGPAPPPPFGAGSLRLTGPPLLAEPFALNAERARAAAVVVQGPEGEAGGVLLTEDGWLLTVAHVTRGVDVVRVRLADGRTVWGRVERRGPLGEVALLRATGRGFRGLPVRPTPIAPGERAHALGQTIGQGTVTAARAGGNDGGTAVLATTPMPDGRNGRPLVDAWGNLSGLGLDGVALFLPIHDALRRLDVSVANATPGGPGVASESPAPSWVAATPPRPERLYPEPPAPSVPVWP
ncbi:trypsin-like peptidase domain-containing protein [Roseospira navarrensis]|uniref:trypsin-like peptidase domain-containing protein n=1 Tax=Roseospira navarrensis TaxID=140058 RepID=UPI001478D3EA